VPHDLTAAALLREVGLLVDGPLPWGRPVPERGPGVFVIEMAAPRPTPPIELSLVGKWLERVPDLRLDGERPTSRALATRLASFWLPAAVILYVGTAETSIGGRVAAIERTVLGDRRPSSAAHWLKTLTVLPATRLWWATTDAVEEYEDALLSAFAETTGVADTDRPILPFANLRRPTGERRDSGITGSLLADPVTTTPPPSRVVILPDGDAEGADGRPAPSRRRPATAGRSRASSAAADGPAATAASEALAPDALTPDGAARLKSELDELTLVRRPEVIGRIRTAKEHGDLKENAEYHAAREEQSFLEGRVQAIEARLRTAVIVEAPTVGSRVGLGSIVTLDDAGDTVTYTIVGADESDPASGRISSSSPVGRALVGRDQGDDVVVKTPAGEARYRIVEIG
jgi:transcription elongation factor GreA